MSACSIGRIALSVEQVCDSNAEDLGQAVEPHDADVFNAAFDLAQRWAADPCCLTQGDLGQSAGRSKLPEPPTAINSVAPSRDAWAEVLGLATCVSTPPVSTLPLTMKEGGIKELDSLIPPYPT